MNEEHAKKMMSVFVHIWPNCARCMKPVEEMKSWTDPISHMIKAQAICHGDIQTIEIPPDVFASGEAFSFGEAFSEAKQLSIGVDLARPGSEKTIQSLICDGKLIDAWEIVEIRIDVDAELLKLATPEERQEFQTNLFNFGSIATADYDADIDWSDSHHWIIRIPARHEREVRALLPAPTEVK